MNLAIDVLLHAGRSAVDVALYTLLPITVLMMIVMRAHSRLVPPCASSHTLLSPKLRSEACGHRHRQSEALLCFRLWSAFQPLVRR